MRSIELSAVDRGGISDADLVIKGHRICNQIYSARGDLSSALCPLAAEFASGLAEMAP